MTHDQKKYPIGTAGYIVPRKSKFRDTAYDDKPQPIQQNHGGGRGVALTVVDKGQARRTRLAGTARVDTVAAMVLEWESACTAGDVAWQCHVIAEMCAAGGIGLAVSWEREIG